MLPRRLGHREAALARRARSPPRSIIAPGRRERRELADRVADDVVRLDPARAQRGEHGEARGDERRLLHLGLDEVLERRVEAELLQVEPGGLAAALEHRHRLGHRLGDVTAHPGLERALAGEAERDLRHAAFSSVHSITPEPQVRPGAHPRHQHELPRPEPSVGRRVGERERDRAGRGVAVAVDVDHHALRRDAELAAPRGR